MRGLQCVSLLKLRTGQRLHVSNLHEVTSSTQAVVLCDHTFAQDPSNASEF